MDRPRKKGSAPEVARGDLARNQSEPKGCYSMLRFYVRVKDLANRFKRDDSGQDAFEYLLVIGVVMVAIVTAIALGGDGPVTAVWNAVSGKVEDLATNGAS